MFKPWIILCCLFIGFPCELRSGPCSKCWIIWLSTQSGSQIGQDQHLHKTAIKLSWEWAHARGRAWSAESNTNIHTHITNVFTIIREAIYHRQQTPSLNPFQLFVLQTGSRQMPAMDSTASMSPAGVLYVSSLCLHALVTGALRPPEVEGLEEVDLGKQRWESIVPLTDRGSRALWLFLWRQGWRRSGLSVRGCF